MTRLVEFETESGSSVLIEVEDVESDSVKPVSKSPGEIAAKARQTFDEALDGIKPMIESLKKRLDDVAESAEEVK